MNVGPSGFPVHRTLTAAGVPAHLAMPVTVSPAGASPSEQPSEQIPARSGRHYGTRPPVVRRRLTRDPRSPAAGLSALVVFAFLAAFLAWFTAYPLWLSLGHGRAGTAIVARCPVAGLSSRCADFEASDKSFSARVTLIGPASMHVRSGTLVPARMVSADGSIAYAGDPGSLYLRWVPSLVLLLLCGFGIAWSTGTFRLPGRRARWLALFGSLSGPMLLLAGMLAVTW